MQLVQYAPEVTFEKVAAIALLSPNPGSHETELISALYKQHPFLGKYQVSLAIDRKDEGGRYMQATFHVRTSSSIPTSADPNAAGRGAVPMEQQGDEQQGTALRIPVVVDDRKVKPFDVFIDPQGAFFPLTERRVSAQLFDANPMMTAPQSMHDRFKADQLQGMGGPGIEQFAGSPGSGRGVQKMSSPRSPLQAVELSVDDVSEVVTRVAEDPALLGVVRQNDSLRDALIKCAHASSVNEVLPQESEEPQFAAAVVSKIAGGYRVKTAALDGTISITDVPNSQSERLQPYVRQQVANTGFSLVTSEEGILPDAGFSGLASNFSEVEKTGHYRVLEQGMRPVDAFVTTDVYRLDGSQMDSVLVVGEKGSAFMDKVAGAFVSEANGVVTELGAPAGYGSWFMPDGSATEPVEVIAHVTEDGRDSYLVESPVYGQVKVATMAGVYKPVIAGRREFLLPEGSAFIPLTQGQYMEDAGLIEKQASIAPRVTLRAVGSEYSFEDGYSKDRVDGLNLEEAMFKLACYGDSARGALMKIVSADRGERVEFFAKYAGAAPAPKPSLPDLGLMKLANYVRCDMLKVAAALAPHSSPHSVDSVLSLNFVTPENITQYVNNLPMYEECVSKLSELLIASRLGLKEVPESAVQSAVRGLENAIHGLRQLEAGVNMSAG